MRDPILICGCPGSGTSLLAKMLRHCGVFLGDDAGPLTDRKFHESKSFRDANASILTHTINFPHAPKDATQFRQHNKRMRAGIEAITRLVDRDGLLQQFWAAENRNQPWGWKDPRNSATALIWQTLFPRLRVLVLERKWNDNVGKEVAQSKAGEWFRTQSNKQIRRFYQNPIGIRQSQIIRVDFSRLVSDARELNSALTSLGLGHQAIKRFDAFSEMIGIEFANLHEVTRHVRTSQSWALRVQSKLWFRQRID